MRSSQLLVPLLLTGALALTPACKKSEDPAGATGSERLAGEVRLDGSSTVFPISEAVAEEFGKVNAGVRVPVGTSGTGGGFKKFCAGEIDIANASRPIKETELAACKKNGIDFVELPVAYDGIAIVVNPRNEFLKSITIDELKTIWAADSQDKIKSWKQVNPAWPDQPLVLFGAGVDSGTYDYFTEAVTGKAKSSRGDYTSSEDDNTLVTGVAGNEGALGFFGIAYYENSKDKLRLVPVDGGKGAITPTLATIADGSYSPLSRPLFIYVSKQAIARPEVRAFIDYYVANAGPLGEEVGYIALPEKAYALVKTRADKQIAGTVFQHGVSTVGMTIEQLLATQEGGAAAPAPEPVPVAKPADEPSK